MENAQTLGLYISSSANGGGSFSRFDRGTSAQQNDEQYVAASAQQNDEQYGNYNVAANAPMAPFGHAPAHSSASTAESLACHTGPNHWFRSLSTQSRDRSPDQPGQESPAKAFSRAHAFQRSDHCTPATSRPLQRRPSQETAAAVSTTQQPPTARAPFQHQASLAFGLLSGTQRPRWRIPR